MEVVFDSIDECGPASFDDIFANSDGVPGVVFIGAFDVDSDACRCSGFAIDDAHFVVDELHGFDAWVEGGKSFSQCGIHGVDRSVTFGGFDADMIADFQFEDGFCKLAIVGGVEITGEDLIFDRFEVLDVGIRAAFDE